MLPCCEKLHDLVVGKIALLMQPEDLSDAVNCEKRNLALRFAKERALFSADALFLKLSRDRDRVLAGVLAAVASNGRFAEFLVSDNPSASLGLHGDAEVFFPRLRNL